MFYEFELCYDIAESIKQYLVIGEGAVKYNNQMTVKDSLGLQEPWRFGEIG